MLTSLHALIHTFVNANEMHLHSLMFIQSMTKYKAFINDQNLQYGPSLVIVPNLQVFTGKNPGTAFQPQI